MRAIIAALIFSLMSTQVSASENVLDLTVTIDGAKPSQGQIIATLFSSEETYMKTPLAEMTSPVDEWGRAELVFEELQPGEFALSIIYDKNNNGKLDTNFLGIPNEKIGFSNNARPSMGPAPYRKAKFFLSPESKAISISLKKAKK